MCDCADWDHCTAGDWSISQELPKRKRCQELLKQNRSQELLKRKRSMLEFPSRGTYFPCSLTRMRRCGLHSVTNDNKDWSRSSQSLRCLHASHDPEMTQFKPYVIADPKMKERPSQGNITTDTPSVSGREVSICSGLHFSGHKITLKKCLGGERGR